MTKTLRVSIGPVQGFISSGRRTRDFWAGSFLLSWLSGIAMQAVIDEAGKITIPVVYDAKDKISEPTLKAIINAGKEDIPAGPLVGTLVNHFRAEVPDDFVISVIETAVREKFKALADEVFEIFIKPVLSGAKLAEVMDRWQAQTNGDYFEILAVMGDAPDWAEESQWLERRKLLRTHSPLTAEKGADRCPVHGDLVELGGFSGQYDRKDQDTFWQKLREVVGSRMYEEGGAGSEKWTDTGRKFRDTLEIRESEHLSGMALVKRLFPLLQSKRIAQVIGWMPDHIYNIRTQAQIWNPEEAQYALRNWPSTAFIAAIPWIVKVGGEYADAANAYAEAQYNTLGANPIWSAERPQHHRVEGIDKLDNERINGKDGLPKFAILDGTLHFERGLEKRRFDDSHANADQIADDLHTEFRKLFSTVKVDPAKIQDGPASTHYAMLDMDGDGMGAVFSHSKELAERGSRALLEFSTGVPAVIRKHDGLLIYAGADDVNAMLPIETAIPCALAINHLWTATIQNSFVRREDPTPTLSGSIVFADYQNALNDVRHLTHERLDKVAKDGMGRDALALAVMKSGGMVSQWASNWHSPDCSDCSDCSNGRDCPNRRNTAQSLFDYARAAGESKTIASRLPYLIRERFGEVLAGRTDDGRDLFSDEQLADFLKDTLSGSALSGLGATDREKAVKITEILRPFYRLRGTTDPINAQRHVGGLLVARFLAKNCMWSYVLDRENRSGGTP